MYIPPTNIAVRLTTKNDTKPGISPTYYARKIKFTSNVRNRNEQIKSAQIPTRNKIYKATIILS